MARVETRDRRAEELDRPGEEHLDDWFARRLQSQGIPSKLGATPGPRVLAVLGLALALVAFLWALSSVGAHTSSSQPVTPTTSNPGPTSTGTEGDGGKKHHGKVSWKNVTVDVLNGFGGSGAAASAASQLRAQGWTVGATGNAQGITKTEVVYAPGNRAQAKAVAKKLGVGAPVPIAQATGVPPTATTGVAVVLGPDGVPTGA
jgi:hypothetical protein